MWNSVIILSDCSDDQGGSQWLPGVVILLRYPISYLLRNDIRSPNVVLLCDLNVLTLASASCKGHPGVLFPMCLFCSNN